jgi:DNA polymerase III delta subunit
MPPTAPLGYYWGNDSYSVNHGPDALAARLAAESGPIDRVRLAGSSTSADEIAEKVATATLFGGGTLVVVAEPGPLVSGKAASARMAELLGQVAPGNGLAFVETVDTSSPPGAALKALRDAVAAAGGEVREFKAPTSGQMTAWIMERAREREIAIAAPAAALLAERIGANVRENDIDRRRQGELAVSELEKLATYRMGAQIQAEDVAALVNEAVPASVWGFQDAVGMRRAGEAAELAARLDDLPGPVLIAVLHRRLRELVEVADLLGSGTPAGALVRTLKLNPYRAERLAEQARQWSLVELDEALAGLLELDATLKGREGGSDARRHAAVSLWITERVRRRSAR